MRAYLWDELEEGDYQLQVGYVVEQVEPGQASTASYDGADGHC